ncbi:MAG: hypothetical protein ACI35S_03375 [Anaeroplasma sp.]
MKILILTGDLATGKSTFANIISNKYNILLLTKDKIKEILGDDIGFNNREENLKLSKATMSIMFYVLSNSIKINTNIILEANFHQNEIDWLKKINEDILILNFSANVDILYKRFKYRIENENRHIVHQSAGLLDYNKFLEYINNSRNINFNKLKCIDVNADDFSYQNDDNLFLKIESFLKE